MKRFALLLVGAFMMTGMASGQLFRKNLEVQLDEPLTSIQLEWVSIDSDTLMDVVLTGISAEGQLMLITYQNQQGLDLALRTKHLTGFKNGHLEVTDWDHDNRIDVLIAGTTLINTPALYVFENKGDFTFQKNAAKLINHSGAFRAGDLNQDGRTDLVATDRETSLLRIYKNTAGGLVEVSDSLHVKVTDLWVADFNQDTRNDLVVAGTTAQNKPVTQVLYQESDFQFKITSLPAPVDGHLSAIDVQQDGLTDLFGIGRDETGQLVRQLWINKGDWFALNQSSSAPEHAQLFTGDMNSDGKPDQLVSGRQSDLKRVNFILDSLAVIRLDTTGLATQRMGDFDRDGDLDLVQVIDSIGLQWLKVFTNTTPQINQRPGTPGNSFAISAFKKTFLFWQPPQDDLTPTASLTYDVWLGSSLETIVNPSFDLSTGRRMKVSHGNAGTNHSLITNDLMDNRYYYHIQAVDNAYNGSYSTCTGGVLPCFDLTYEDVQVCKNQEVTLTSGGPAFWFSLAKGFLGQFTEFTFAAIANDTVFSFVPQGPDCSKNKVWVIHVNDSSKTEMETIYTCKEKMINLGIEPGWEDVAWNFSPPVFNQDSVSLMVTKADSVIVTAQRSSGCRYSKTFSIRLSEPTLELNGEVFQMMRGGSVQLEAVSTARFFLWTPSTGLSSNNIPNPLAAPAETTTYTVTATDSVGCSKEKAALIQVEETAFVPNLFTPNGDGKNDALLIYGLTQASSFTFQIFNREGSLVYETSNLSQATASGWNGTVAGTRQPSGVYYWKVEGTTSTGQRLLLNGKKTGSILLVH